MKLKRNLGLFEVFGLSIAIIAPTMAMAFNVALTASVAGSAAPLSFIIGTVLMVIVSLSFISFSRKVPSTGAVYSYIGMAFGPRAGFVAGWVMLMVYTTFGSGTIILVGNFLAAALSNYGINFPGISQILSLLGLALAIYCAFRDTKFATRLMLALEILSVLAILILGITIVIHAGQSGQLTAEPFHPTSQFGWAGVGYGLAFAILSFAGFEGVATLAEETKNPRRNIPLAMIGTILLGGTFFVFISYAEVIGFGVDHSADLATNISPLNTLGERYISKPFGAAISIAAAISAFSGCLGCISAASRMMFAIGRSGFLGWGAKIHPTHGTPHRAVLTVGLLCGLGVVVWAPFVGAINYYGYISTIGVLGLILIYLGVTSAELVAAMKSKKLLWSLLSLTGGIALLWPLYSNLYPVPAYPYNLWPYVVILWIVFGVAITWLNTRARAVELIPQE